MTIRRHQSKSGSVHSGTCASSVHQSGQQKPTSISQQLNSQHWVEMTAHHRCSKSSAAAATTAASKNFSAK
eukprot:1496790-Amphidinium_carterae.1